MSNEPVQLDLFRDENENVYFLNRVTPMDIQPDRVLRWASTHGWTDLMICGHGKDDEFAIYMTYANAGDCLYAIDRVRWKLMQKVDSMERKSQNAD